MKYIRESKEDAFKFAAEKIKESIDKLQAKDNIVIALPGGRNVAGILQNLRTMDIDWNKIHIFMVDERLVPLGHKDSNFLITQKELAEHVSIPKENLHPFDMEKGIRKYERELEEIQDYFDIVLLSSGEDGHIGALYPNHPSAKDQADFFITIDDSPKPPAERMTSARRLLIRSKYAILMFIGNEKRAALAAFDDRLKSFKNCPAKMVKEIQNNFVIVAK